MVDPAQLAQFAANGVVVGSILALAAVGLTLVYGILHLANFAHGDLVTLGAYLGLFFSALMPPASLTRWAWGAAALLLGAVALDRLLPRLPPGPDDPTLSRTETGLAVVAAALLGALVLGWRTGLGWIDGWTLAVAVAAAGAGPLWDVRDRLADRPKATAAVAGAALAVAAGHRLLGAGAPVGPAGPWGWTVGFALLPLAALAPTVDPETLTGRPARLGLSVALLVVAAAGGSRFVLGVVLAILGGMAVSVLTDLAIWRYLRSRDAGLITLVIASIGLALALRNAIVIKWTSDIRTYPGPVTQAEEILGTGVALTETEVAVIGVAAVAIVGVHVLLRHTRIGTAMRALADNEELARVTGIDVDRVILYVWIIAGGLAALAGVLLGNLRSFQPTLGWLLLLPIFASVILGGIGSPYGAIAGGMFIGIAMEVSPALGVPTRYKSAVGFVILIAVLLVRPEGIFGGQATR